MYLQLVLAGLMLRARVEKVDGENLEGGGVSWACSSRCFCAVSWGRGRRWCAESAVVCVRRSSSCLVLRVCPAGCDVPYWRLPEFN